MNRNKKAYYILIGFYLFCSTMLFAQDQKVADSLKLIYQKDTLSSIAKMQLLKDLSFNETRDLDFSLSIAEELISLATQLKSDVFLYEGYMKKGNSYLFSADYNLALEAYIKSANIALNSNLSNAKEGSSYIVIADTYSEIGNTSNAKLYYDKAITTLRNSDDKVLLATALLNAGDEFFNSKDYNKALQYFEESGELFKEADYLIGTAYNLGNKGMVYAEQEKDNLAMANINEAITILEEMEDYYAISEYLTYMSDIYLKQNKFFRALDYTQKSLDLAQKYGLKKQISDSNLQLSHLYEQMGNAEATLSHYKDHITYRDSVRNIEAIQRMANLEVSQKQLEVDVLNEKQRTQRIIVIAIAIALFLIGLLAFGLYRRNKFVQKTNTIIANEKERSDRLLLNILPEETAQELKDKGKVKAQKYDSVTVLFSDFKGFTKYAESLSPEELVESVDFYFSKFDEIVEKHGMEKIKTIGDAYMCAGGLHGETHNHESKMIDVALEMAEFVKQSKAKQSKKEPRFDIRIGINSGPVVAGVVGTHKFAYDIWGDTVNVASRMESNSEPGKINISENAYKAVKNEFDCEFRGKLEVKNRGQLNMYFVNEKKNSITNTSKKENSNNNSKTHIV